MSINALEKRDSEYIQITNITSGPTITDKKNAKFL